MPSCFKSCWAESATATEEKQEHGNAALGFREAKEPSQTRLGWKGPMRITEPLPGPAQGTPRVTPRAQEYCQMKNHDKKIKKLFVSP